MAGDYISYGTERGNATMAGFDGYATRMSQKIDRFRDGALRLLDRLLGSHDGDRPGCRG